MAIKFSQFVLKTLPSELDYIVGYTGTENLQITPDNFLAPYLGAYLPLAGGTMTGNTLHGDDDKDIYGTGNDLEIYHSGSDSYIRDVGSGSIRVTASKFTVLNAANNEEMIDATENGAVELYYDNALRLDTTNDGVGIRKDNSGALGPVLLLDNTAGGNGDSSAIVFASGGNTYQRAQIKCTADLVAPYNGSIEFYTGRSDLGTLTEKMRIAYDGSVGIGTDAPAKKLDVTVDANDDGILLQVSGRKAMELIVNSGVNGQGMLNFYTGNTLHYGRINADSEGLNLDTIANRSMIFKKAGVETMRIDTSGDVGIGTGAPIEKLDVDGAIISTASNVTSSTAGANRAFIDFTAGGARLGHFRGTTVAGSGSVKLYSDSVVGITLDASQDATFARHIILGDGGQLQCGPLSGGDLKFYWDTSDGNIINKTGHLYIKNQANDKSIYFETDDGVGGTTNYIVIDGVSNYTQFDMAARFMDNVHLQFGSSNDAGIYHNGTDLYVTNYSTDGDLNFRADNGSGSVTNYFFLDGGVEKTRFYQGANFEDNVKLTFGNVVSPDLQIYHDGVNSYIEDIGTGNMYIQFYERLRFQDNTGGGGTIAAFNVDSSGCQLYHIGALKIQTTATGTVTTGQMDIAALNTAPASAGAAGTLGEIRYTADYIYVCTATNTWKRTALTTW